jgi:hypothetical protein
LRLDDREAAALSSLLMPPHAKTWLASAYGLADRDGRAEKGGHA